MKNLMISLIILISFIFIEHIFIPKSFDLNTFSVYAVGKGGEMRNKSNKGKSKSSKMKGGNNPKAQANRNKNKNQSKSQPRIYRGQNVGNNREQRVQRFCEKNKGACGMDRKRITRTDEEKRLIAIELIETINRYRENNNQKEK